MPARHFKFSVLSKRWTRTPKRARNALTKHLVAPKKQKRRSAEPAQHAGDAGLGYCAEEARPFEPLWELGNEGRQTEK
jgi:hypothetical protein